VIAMTDHIGRESLSAGREDDDPRRVEIVLPRARSIVWLGLKVYLIVVLGVPLIGMAVALLAVALIVVMG
jgi:hypothetical protein